MDRLIIILQNQNAHTAYNKICFGYGNSVPDFELLYDEYVVLELESGVQNQDFSMFEPIETNHSLNKQISLFNILVDEGYFFKHHDVFIHKPIKGVW